MAIDAKKNTSPAPGEVPIRKALADMALSGNTIVPVAGATEQAQIVAALAPGSFPVGPSRPLTTYRQDAPGLHRIEYTPDGSAWVPASGVLHFPTIAAANAWAATNSALLSAGDYCMVGADQYTWTSGGWLRSGALGSLSANTVADLDLIRRLDLVTPEGRLYKSGGATFGAAELAGVVPTGYRPTRSQGFIPTPMLTTGFAWVMGAAEILSSGELRVNMTGAASIAFVGFGGTPWRTA